MKQDIYMQFSAILLQIQNRIHLFKKIDTGLNHGLDSASEAGAGLLDHLEKYLGQDQPDPGHQLSQLLQAALLVPLLTEPQTKKSRGLKSGKLGGQTSEEVKVKKFSESQLAGKLGEWGAVG